MTEKTDSSWLSTVIDNEIDSLWDRLKEDIDSLWKRNPTADPDILANDFIDSKAKIAAFVGIGTGALAAIPEIGTLLSMGAILPEALYLAKMQIDIALSMAMLYDQKLNKYDVKGVIVSCFVLALGADFIKQNINKTATHITKQVIEKAIGKMGEEALVKLLEKIGIQATKEGILKKVPVISVVINPTMNYGQIQGFSWVVKKFLSPSFVMCGNCSEQTGKLNKFCPKCGARF